MRALLALPGSPAPLSLADVPAPEPGPGEVLVAVAASGVNRVDAATAAGEYHRLGLVRRDGPVGVGWEFAGVVERLGPGAGAGRPELRPGARVAGLHDGFDVPTGAHADAVGVPAAAVALLPEGLGLTEAAAVPLNALTAAQALDRAGPPRGRLLVTGAAGAVGAWAVQLAASAGWEVTALARSRDAAELRALGAHRTVQDVPRGGCAAVLDAAVLGAAALRALQDGGTLVGVRPGAEPVAPPGRSVVAVAVRADPVGLARLLGSVRAGALDVRVRALAPLAAAVAAVGAGTGPGTRGRTVLVD
ncbi:alcohol dehydrogenase catalytic domain-containing protein [Kineococcus gypseus]|uniref:alcohol dehydrogenase catalytic domain-containing protein n=1 Tax=Kineococcus gypseus TaxID=1637102 RepID=UPI003D7DFFE2